MINEKREREAMWTILRVKLRNGRAERTRQGDENGKSDSKNI